MPVIFQHRIYRCDLRNNPNVYYVFGDNMMRVGMAGQAAEMRGEPNAIGVPTKHAPGMREKDFFTDNITDEDFKAILLDFEKICELLQSGYTVVFPSDGLGTGLSELPSRAPTIFEWFNSKIKTLKALYG